MTDTGHFDLHLDVPAERGGSVEQPAETLGALDRLDLSVDELPEIDHHAVDHRLDQGRARR